MADASRPWPPRRRTSATSPAWTAAAAWMKLHGTAISGGCCGSTNASGCAGYSARRTATSASARAARSGSSISHLGSAPTTIEPGGRPLSRASVTPRSCSARARPARVGGSGRDPGREVGRDDERARADEHARPGPSGELVCERVVGQSALGLDTVGDDLRHDVGADHVDALERGDESALRRAERRRDRSKPDIGLPLGGGLVDGGAQHRERALAAGRDGILAVHPRLLPRPPFRDVTAGAGQPVGLLPADRDLDAKQVEARLDQGRDLVERRVEVGLAEGRRQPRPRDVAEHRERSFLTVRCASIRSSAPAASRRASTSATTRRSRWRRSSASSDRSTAPDATSSASRCGWRSYSTRAIANGRVIPVEQAARIGRQPAVDGRSGQRSAGRIEPADTEQPEHRPLAADVVEPRARPPHAPASASARSTRRSSGPIRASRRSLRGLGPSGAESVRPVGIGRRPVLGPRPRLVADPDVAVARIARPSRSAPGPSSRRWRSGQPGMPRRGGGRPQRPRCDASPSGTSPVRWTIARRCHAEPLERLVRDLAEGRERHRLEGLVSEAFDRTAGVSGGFGLLPGRRRAGRDPGPAEEPDDRPVLGESRARPRARRGSPGERRVRDLRIRSVRRGPLASSSPPHTGGMNATSSPSSSGVAGSA